jgi:hypothetical protein
MEAGSNLDITLTLPAEITRGTDVFVRAHGKVVRVEPRLEDGESRMGVAAVIERYDIIRGENGRAWVQVKKEILAGSKVRRQFGTVLERRKLPDCAPEVSLQVHETPKRIAIKY